MIKAFMILLVISGVSHASGPKYRHSDAKLDDEISNIYYDIRNTLSGDVRISSLTVSYPIFGATNVVQTASAGISSSTSVGSFTSTGFSVTITPRSVASRIKLFVSSMVNVNSSSTTGQWTIYRNNTTEISGNSNGLASVRPGSTASTTERAQIAFGYVDSPATTSATTYTVYQLSTSGANPVTFGEVGVSVFIAEEIL